MIKCNLKNLLILATILLTASHSLAQDAFCPTDQIVEYHLKFSDLSEGEKVEAIKALVAGSCYYKGIKLWGKVQFVTSFPDIKIQYVESFPDFKIQVVNSFPDIKIKVVESFPGVE